MGLLGAKKRTFLRCARGACGFQAMNKDKKSKVCGCGALRDCAGRVGCALVGGGGLPGAPEGGVTVALFLDLLAWALFVGWKSDDFWGARNCLWASTDERGLKKQGLPLRCPGGLRGAPGVCGQKGASQGAWRGVSEWHSFWASRGPPWLAKKTKTSGVRAGACGLSLM